MKNDLKKRYRRERNRVLSVIRKARKEGFSGLEAPSIPKKLTEGSIRKLQSQYSTKKINEKMTKGGTTRKSDIIHRRFKRSTPTMSTPKSAQTVVEVNEYDFLVDRIKNLIDNVQNYPIPVVSKAIHAICIEAFEGFVLDTIDDKSEEACQVMRQMAEDSLFYAEFYDSDQIADAQAWAHDIERMASALQSDKLSELANSVATADETFDFDTEYNFYDM